MPDIIQTLFFLLSDLSHRWYIMFFTYYFTHIGSHLTHIWRLSPQWHQVPLTFILHHIHTSRTSPQLQSLAHDIAHLCSSFFLSSFISSVFTYFAPHSFLTLLISDVSHFWRLSLLTSLTYDVTHSWGLTYEVYHFWRHLLLMSLTYKISHLWNLSLMTPLTSDVTHLWKFLTYWRHSLLTYLDYDVTHFWRLSLMKSLIRS